MSAVTDAANVSLRLDDVEGWPSGEPGPLLQDALADALLGDARNPQTRHQLLIGRGVIDDEP